jgi:hypothetical protein
LPITAGMVFGTMSREFYLKEHDPARWAVQSSKPQPGTSHGD